MKTKSKPERHRFPLSLMHHGNSYYIDRMVELETALAAKPRELQIDLMGEGEMQADWVLLLRSILKQRSPKTQIITNARSSLSGGSVLAWLLGDRRLIREDARVFFRRATTTVTGEEDDESTWEEGESNHGSTYVEADPEEAGYAQVLQHINEFLPVQEMAGRMIDVATLRQFGLVENDKLDRFLMAAFSGPMTKEAAPVSEPKPKRTRAKAKVTGPGTLKE